MLPLKVLEVRKGSSLKEFIDFWSLHYDYKKKHLYENNIHRKRYGKKSVQELFEWKNNMKLSGKKQKTVNHIKENIETVNLLKRDFDASLFTMKFGEISFVWRIFLMHIIAPDTYPLYDQHIHRAHIFLLTGQVTVGKLSFAEKLSFYNDEYRPFFDELCKKGKLKSRKRLDDALWSLGKFLSRYPKMIS